MLTDDDAAQIEEGGQNNGKGAANSCRNRSPEGLQRNPAAESAADGDKSPVRNVCRSHQERGEEQEEIEKTEKEEASPSEQTLHSVSEDICAAGKRRKARAHHPNVNRKSKKVKGVKKARRSGQENPQHQNVIFGS